MWQWSPLPTEISVLVIRTWGICNDRWLMFNISSRQFEHYKQMTIRNKRTSYQPGEELLRIRVWQIKQKKSSLRFLNHNDKLAGSFTLEMQISHIKMFCPFFKENRQLLEVLTPKRCFQIFNFQHGTNPWVMYREKLSINTSIRLDWGIKIQEQKISLLLLF